MPIDSQTTAAPSASDAVTGARSKMMPRTGVLVGEAVAEVAVQDQSLHVEDVLVVPRLVEVVERADLRQPLRRAVLAAEVAGLVARRDDEEQQEDREADDGEHDEAEQRPADDETTHGWTFRYLRARTRAARGSSASRRPSPSRLKASVVMNSARLGKSRNHRRLQVGALRLGDHVAPGRRRDRYAEAEERQRRLEHDRGRDEQRRVDDDRRDEVGHDVDDHDAQVARAERPRRLDVLLLRIDSTCPRTMRPTLAQVKKAMTKMLIFTLGENTDTSEIANSRKGNDRKTSIVRDRNVSTGPPK